MSELACIKAKIEDENTQLLGERAKLIDHLKKLQADKVAKRQDVVELKKEVFLSRVDLKSLSVHVEALAAHVESQRQIKGICDKEIEDQLRMTQYSAKVENLRQEFENATHLYGEDNLQMELLKHSNSNREKRVELTRLTQEIEAKEKQIEEERQEKEKKKIEAERQEMEKKEIEAERQEMEKEKQAESALSFRQVTNPTQGPPTPTPPKRLEDSTKVSAASFLQPFSQLYKW